MMKRCCVLHMLPAQQDVISATTTPLQQLYNISGKDTPRLEIAADLAGLHQSPALQNPFYLQV